MALADQLRGLPPWALYGGAGVGLGGGYLLYKRRKASASAGTSGGTSPTSMNVTAPLQTDSGQQSGIVPYYLTGNPNATSPAPVPPPLPVGASVPAGTGVDATGGGNVLPAIPPLLPVNPSGTPTPAAPAPSVPAPAPGGSNNIPADLLAKIQAGGEQIIGQLAAPGGGTWWLGSRGGVFAEGGAPFFGSARPYGFDDPNVRKAIAIQPLGRGYRVISSRGENYDFTG